MHLSVIKGVHKGTAVDASSIRFIITGSVATTDTGSTQDCIHELSTLE